jgi:hypothetical protein
MINVDVILITNIDRSRGCPVMHLAPAKTRYFTDSTEVTVNTLFPEPEVSNRLLRLSKLMFFSDAKASK